MTTRARAFPTERTHAPERTILPTPIPTPETR